MNSLLPRSLEGLRPPFERDGFSQSVDDKGKVFQHKKGLATTTRQRGSTLPFQQKSFAAFLSLSLSLSLG